MQKVEIQISGEILGFSGRGSISMRSWPDAFVALGFQLATTTFSFHPHPEDLKGLLDSELVLFVSEDACDRIFGSVIDEPFLWHLPADLQCIAMAVHGAELPVSSLGTFRMAKSLELLCSSFQKMAQGTLVEADYAGELTEIDSRRVAQARRLIDERWSEKLSLDRVARECGLNRAKLTRSFRTMFNCSVAEAITERRMIGAREMVIRTDLPISSIGYRCGYQNKSSFSRAFARHFGLAPTQVRAHRLAA